MTRKQKRQKSHRRSCAVGRSANFGLDDVECALGLMGMFFFCVCVLTGVFLVYLFFCLNVLLGFMLLALAVARHLLRKKLECFQKGRSQ